MPNRNPYTFDRVVRLVIGTLTVLGILWLIDVLKDVLLPFFVACLIAYMFEPFVQYNRRLLHLKGRAMAIFVTLFEALFFIGLLGYFLIPMVLDEIHQMADIMRRYAVAQNQIRFLPREIHDYLRRTVDFNKLSDMLTTIEWGRIVENTLSATWDIITGSISVILGIFSWFIVVLYVVFIMIDYDRLSNLFHHMIPPKYRATAAGIGRDLKRSMNHYFRGQALVAFTVGILFSIGFLIIGLPMAVVLGMFIGLLNMVPYLQLISIVPTTLLCLVYAAGGGGDFWTIFWECIAVYAVVQIIQDFFLTPKIMGKAMGLNPALILLSLSIWGSLLGLIGLIIALPLTTLLLAYYNRYIIMKADNGDITPHQAQEELKALDSVTESPLD
ncbi:MAG: AI-2E family transporter [Muribaculaceae bacterium]|nr:AI-2E family transporter [Muribaculaceae bacterium]